MDVQAINTRLEAALQYASRGWPVPPVHTPRAGGSCSCRLGAKCPSPGKHPRIKDWQNAATADEKQVRAWWEKWPDANVGIVMGERSGLVALDVDRRSGGLEALAALEDEHGPLPDTLVAHTGGGGRHFLFRYPSGGVRSMTICTGVELKSDRTFIVAASSVHASGREYVWEEEADAGDAEIALLPGWVHSFALGPAPSGNGGEGGGAGEMPEITAGSRNNMLFSLGATMQRRGMPKDAIAAALKVVNETKCIPPLSDEELTRIVESAGKYPPEPSAVPKSSVAEIHNSDLGNARRLVAAHGSDIRHVTPWKDWLIWDDIRWRKDDTGSVIRRAKTVVNKLYSEASDIQDPDTRKNQVRFALRSEMEPRLRGMLELAKSEPGIPVLPKDLDTDPNLLNALNGTLDLRTGDLMAPKRDHLMTKIAPVRFDPSAACPLWESFLDRIFDANPRLISYVKRAVGYSLTGSTEEQVFFLLYGTGQNGKSKFLEAIRGVLGDYARQTDFKTFLESKGDHIRNDLARLFGARFVTAIETKRKSTFDEAVIKQVTGGDIVTARFLYREYFEFLPAFKVWLATNHKPEIRGTDEGIWRRVQLIPFTIAIPKPEQDKKLGEKLQAEAEGIFRWAVEGAREWQESGLSAPPEVTTATSAYREESDLLAGFLNECCSCGPGLSVGATDLYQSYVHWVDQQRGEEKLSQRALSTALEEHGILKDRKGGEGRVRYLGIALNAVEETRLKGLKDVEGCFG
jgi:putative DNA primase/helicase